MSVKPRKEILEAKPVAHGGLNFKRLKDAGIAPEEVLDFSVNVCPFPLPKEVLDAAHGSIVRRYPDGHAGSLVEALAELNRTSEESILAVNGVSQAILLLAFGYIEKNDNILIIGPTYGEYAATCRLMGAKIHTISMREEDNFKIRTDLICKGLYEKRPKLLWICTPNNPTGQLILPEEIYELQQCCIETETLLILDEAYGNFADPSVLFPDPKALVDRGNVLLMRSMTKDYGLTGLRVGYVVSEPQIIDVLRTIQPPWSINSAAQAAGIVAIQKTADYGKLWRQTRNMTITMMDQFMKMGFNVIPSVNNFFLASHESCAALVPFLKNRNILVRDCSSFGLSGYIRVGTRNEEENTRLVQEVRRYITNHG